MFDTNSGYWLASRRSRLAAVLLDALLLVPGLGVVAFAAWSQLGLALRYKPYSPPPSAVHALENLVVLGYVLFFGVLVLQLVYLALHQQTLGKRALGLRILRRDGRCASGGRAIVLRTFVPHLIGLLTSLVALGPVLGLIDCLCIFRSDRRCIHDMIAGTIVVKL
jgi:uncharacterized RDD family membrane protein YckC